MRSAIVEHHPEPLLHGTHRQRYETVFREAVDGSPNPLVELHPRAFGSAMGSIGKLSHLCNKLGATAVPPISPSSSTPFSCV